MLSKFNLLYAVRNSIDVVCISKGKNECSHQALHICVHDCIHAGIVTFYYSLELETKFMVVISSNCMLFYIFLMDYSSS